MPFQIILSPNSFKKYVNMLSAPSTPPAPPEAWLQLKLRNPVFTVYIGLACQFRLLTDH